MAVKSLAVKYRPKTFDTVVEQYEIRTILEQQLETGTIKNAYLFVGSAGTGKTTCARIFANEINKGKGNPIEMDAASNSGVDDVRNISQIAKTKSFDSEYKVFIIDECHAISNTGWQAFLKLIEEPPAKSIFIFCTTDAHKIPKTILSRVQRYDFKRISQEGIVNRLWHILEQEDTGDKFNSDIIWEKDAVEYIAKLAEGGMRDAITLMDKCLSYSKKLTLENVIMALGVTDYKVMMELTDYLLKRQSKEVMSVINNIHSEGKDLKQFVRSYTYFLLDIEKYAVGCPFNLLQVPELNDYSVWFRNLVMNKEDVDFCKIFLGRMITLNSDIKYSSYPKADIEATLLMLCLEDG